MTKQYILPILLAISCIVNAQKKVDDNTTPPKKRVGVNTETPQQTLDVNGTVRIKEPRTLTDAEVTTAGEKITPLGVDTARVVTKITDDSYAPFKVVDFVFTLNKENPKYLPTQANNTIATDLINNADLKISTDKYTAILLSYTTYQQDGDNVETSLLPVLGYYNTRDRAKVSDRNTKAIGQIFNGQQGDRGFIHDDKAELYSGYLFIPQPVVMLYPDTKSKTWKFYADYPSTFPLSFEFEDSARKKIKRYKFGDYKFPQRYDLNTRWKITVMIVDNNLIKKIDIKANRATYEYSDWAPDGEPSTELTN